MKRKAVKPGQVCPECRKRVTEKHMPLKDCDYHPCSICGPIVADASKIVCTHKLSEQCRKTAEIYREKGVEGCAEIYEQCAAYFEQRERDGTLGPPPTLEEAKAILIKRGESSDRTGTRISVPEHDNGPTRIHREPGTATQGHGISLPDF